MGSAGLRFRTARCFLAEFGPGSTPQRQQGDETGGAMKKRRASARRFHCPSWARTRTLLIQRWHRNPLNSCNLQLHPRDSAVRCRVSEGQMQFWVAKRPSHCWSACCILAAGGTKLCPPTAAACSSERGRPHWEECDEAQASEGLRLCTAAGNADCPQGGALPLCLGR